MSYSQGESSFTDKTKSPYIFQNQQAYTEMVRILGIQDEMRPLITAVGLAIQKAVADEPTKRYPSISEFAEDVQTRVTEASKARKEKAFYEAPTAKDTSKKPGEDIVPAEFIARIYEVLKQTGRIDVILTGVLSRKSSKSERCKKLEAIFDAIPEDVLTFKLDEEMCEEIYRTGHIIELDVKVSEIFSQADSSFQNGNFAEALQNYNQYLQLQTLFGVYIRVGGNNENLLYNRAVALHNLHRYEEAIDIYDQIITSINHRLEERSRRSRGRVENLGFYTEMANEKAKLLCSKAASLIQLGKNEEALSAYDAASDLSISVEPGSPPMPILKGNLLLKLNREEEALASYREAAEEYRVAVRDVEDNTDYPVNQLINQLCTSLVKVGSTFLKLARYDEALQSFDETIALDEKNIHAWKGKAEALRKLGRIDEADEALKNTSF